MSRASARAGSHDDELGRYSRQMLFERIGPSGQTCLKHASVVVVGCGALGGNLANLLVRAGVGFLRLIDRDFIEVNNLQRQPLFDEHDIAEALPKAEAAARKLHRANSAVEIEAVVADFHPANAEELCREADLILDGTDNLETRYLINDVAIARGVPWVYGACLGAEGLVLPVQPGITACLRCVWPDPPAPGSIPTCDTAGILAAAAAVVASLQATEAMKLLMGRTDELHSLLAVDVWSGRIRHVNVQAAYDAGDCPCCRRGQHEFLRGERFAATTSLCGRDAVQILPPEGLTLDLRKIANRLPGTARAKSSDYLLRFQVDTYHVTLFTDGRAIVQGTTDAAIARGVIAKYVGS